MFPTLAALPALVFLGLVLTAAVEDALSFTIPNWISLALLAAFPLAALTVGMPLASAAMNLGVGAAALAAGMGMFALRWVGGGDAKLLAAVCLWLGLPALGLFLLATALAGGALAILLLTLRSDQLRPLILLGPRWISRLADPGESVPYGVAIAIGALVAFPQTLFGAGLGF
ncbi:prepilin peptidase [Phenylobacterium sp.]|jgi:prepilin peptidase CpaA|uniref:prepilin peptidase n=1 Tax=Phenylobacterium sp. TaxID=1871053 RepID=UPI0037CA363A